MQTCLQLRQPQAASVSSRVDLCHQASRTVILPPIAQPVRESNPLSPRYKLPGSSPEPRLGSTHKIYLPYPTASAGFEPGEWRNTSPVRRGALDISDIPGTSPSPTMRPRRRRVSESHPNQDQDTGTGRNDLTLVGIHHLMESYLRGHLMARMGIHHLMLSGRNLRDPLNDSLSTPPYRTSMTVWTSATLRLKPPRQSDSGIVIPCGTDEP